MTDRSPFGATVLIRRPEGFRSFQVWRRLFRTSLPDVPLRSAVCADSGTTDLILSALPPSEAAEIERREPAEGGFEGQSVCVIVASRDGTRLNFLGGPTDEAWDRIEDLLNPSQP